MNQHTLKRSYTYKGNGLHTGQPVEMTLLPAPENNGIVFQRIDLNGDSFVEAKVENVSHTSRSTVLAKNGVEVGTTEHLLSALYGMGVDNALVQLNASELPILDGSAKPYADDITEDGLQDQRVERKYFTVTKPFSYKDEKSGAEIFVTPSDRLEIEVEVDYNSKVLGVQYADYHDGMDYAKEIAPNRTFCFFHELEPLLSHNLIKGGDLDNAIVIVEHPVPQETLDKMRLLFNAGDLKVTQGYLSNVQLHFSNECARHKLLDIIGDFALLGLPLRGKIVAKKSGHSINTKAVQALIYQLK